MSSYTSIGNFGNSQKFPSADPLAMVVSSDLGAGFQSTLGGGILSPDGEQAQKFAALYCAREWNGTCEVLSYNTNRSLPNHMGNCDGPNGACWGSGIGNAITKGQALIRNAAKEKYLKAVSPNCVAEYQPFNPVVADSPLMRTWVPRGGQCNSGQCDGAYSGACKFIYGVNPATIDNDVLMDKILAQPYIAIDILVNMYNHAVRSGEIHKLRHTKLGRYFASPEFQMAVKSGKIQHA